MQPAERRYDSPKKMLQGEVVKASRQQSLSGSRPQEQMEAHRREEESHDRVNVAACLTDCAGAADSRLDPIRVFKHKPDSIKANV